MAYVCLNFKCLKFKCLKNLSAPSPNTSLHAFSWTTPPISERTYFMDDPKVIHNKETSKINKFFFTKFVYESLFCGILKKLPRAYLEPRQTCKMELFVKIVNDLKILTIHKKHI